MLEAQFLVTLLVLVIALMVVFGMIMLERRPRRDLSPRLVPTTLIMLVGGFVAILALVHLANLAGLHTGRFH
ncbi:MAG: hypothetical protein AB7S92_14490 [Parvibaculaceae bacterium]|jgi:hypothetical protein